MYEDIIYKMKQQGIEFATGLKDEEIAIIEQEYKIIFPKELNNFYKEALPISKGFYNWRDICVENVKKIKDAIYMPVQGIMADLAEIDWNVKWGKEPSDFKEKERNIEEMLLKAPKLIPIFSHRYMASAECENAPVFSICGTDVICFAKNIHDYFLVEFHLKEHEIFNNNEVSYIPFWSDLL